MNSVDDFDPKQAIDNLAANLKQPHLFAETFCNAAESQTSIKNVLEKTIKSLIQTDSQTIENIKKLIREIEEEELKLKWKNLFGFFMNALWFVLGAIITGLITKFLH